MAAGGCSEVAAPGQQLQRPEVNLLVAPLGAANGFPGLGKGRRVENNEVVGRFSLRDKLRQQVEDIGYHKIHPVRQAVPGGVGLCHFDGGGGNVHRRHVLRPAHGSVQGEGAGVGEAV